MKPRARSKKSCLVSWEALDTEVFSWKLTFILFSFPEISRSRRKDWSKCRRQWNASWTHGVLEHSTEQLLWAEKHERWRCSPLLHPFRCPQHNPRIHQGVNNSKAHFTNVLFLFSTHFISFCSNILFFYAVSRALKNIKNKKQMNPKNINFCV